MIEQPVAPPASCAPLIKRPWLKYFPSDWRGDELLGMCSLAARGLMIELMNLMHSAEPRGHLLVNGLQPSDADLTRLVRATSIAEMRRLRAELLAHGVLSRNDAGVIYSRRMVREATRSAIGHETGKRGGNPKLTPLTVTVDPTLNGPSNPHILEAICQTPIPPSEPLADDGLEAIAGAFLETYPEIYARCRTGAAYRVNRLKQERDLAYARELATSWPNVERLQDMLEVFLKRTDIGDKNKPGTPGQFLHMAPDCDRLLREYGR